MKQEDSAMSFQEWKDAGYVINKGAKSQIRDIDGIPQFTKNQVKKLSHYRSHGKTMWEKCDDAARRKGTPAGVVEDFDSFVREAGMLPDLNGRTRFNVTDPLEMYFMGVADKHGIFDAVLDGEDEEYY